MRDISVRYKQTIFGILWAVIRPLLFVFIFTVIFSKVAGLPSEGNAPYSIMVLAGMLPWLLFSTGLNEASNSLIGNIDLVNKVYFPKIILPSATILVSFIDFIICLFILAGMLLFYQYWPGWQLLFLQFYFLLFWPVLGQVFGFQL